MTRDTLYTVTKYRRLVDMTTDPNEAEDYSRDGHKVTAEAL